MSTAHAPRLSNGTACTPGLGPIKVLLLDAEHLPREISGARADGGRYEALWALVRRNGRPAALLKLPFVDGRLGAEDLTAHIAQTANGSSDGALRVLQTPLPPVSVIVPTTLERLDHLHLTLQSLQDLDYPVYEVLLVDNRVDSHGAVPAWFERFPSVRLLSERRPGISAARNRGLAAATGELIAFTDDDVTVDPRWLRVIAQRFAAHPEEACVTGLVLPRELETPAQVRLEHYFGGFGPRLLSPVSHRLKARPRGILPRAAPVLELDAAGTHAAHLLAVRGRHARRGRQHGLPCGRPARGRRLRRDAWHRHTLRWRRGPKHVRRARLAWLQPRL